MIASSAVPARLLHHHPRVNQRHTQDHDFADALAELHPDAR
jgi:hypothetical protein